MDPALSPNMCATCRVIAATTVLVIILIVTAIPYLIHVLYLRYLTKNVPAPSNLGPTQNSNTPHVESTPKPKEKKAHNNNFRRKRKQ